MKLRRYEGRYGEKSSEEPRVELLRNVCEDMDSKLIRKRQPLVLHMRISLLVQRLNYMSSMKMQPREKRREIKRCPPIVLLVENTKHKGKLDFMQGVIREKDEDSPTGERFVHLLHPYSPRIVASYLKFQRDLQFINDQLGYTKDPQGLDVAMNWIPCFLVSNYDKLSEKFIRMHKYDSLPDGFDIERHTNYIYPLILNNNHVLNPRLFGNDSDDILADDIPALSLSQILDYTYPHYHGRGTPEDLNKFIHLAEKQELKRRWIRPG